MVVEIDDKKYNLKFVFVNVIYFLCFINEWFLNVVKFLLFWIKRSNVIVGGDGVMFLRVFCDMELYNVEYLFGDIF